MSKNVVRNKGIFSNSFWIILGLLILPLSGYCQNKTLSDNVMQFVSQDDSVLAFKDAILIDGTGRPAIDGASVVVVNGKITRVGPADKVSIPDEATIIDMKGKTLLPGFVMMHEHLFYPTQSKGMYNVGEMPVTFPKLYLAGGVTSMRTAGSIEPYTDINLSHWIDQGIIPGPRIHATGPYIEREGLLIPNVHFIESSEEAGKMVDYWADAGASSFKVYMHITRQDLQAVLDHAHQRQIKVTGHLCSITFREAADLGIDNLEHGFMVSSDFVDDKALDQCPDGIRQSLLALGMDDPKMQELIDHLIDKDVALTSTLPVFEPYIGRGIFPGGGTEAVVPEVREKVMKTWAARQNEDSASAALFKKEMHWEKMFYDKGGLLIAGIDPTGAGRVIPGYANQHSLELLTEAGFAIEDAIKVLTLNGAKYLDLDDAIGSIEPGKIADLIVVDGDLTQDIHAIREMNTVFKNGVGYESQKLFESVEGEVGIH